MTPAALCREAALSFDCAGETLQGVLAMPTDAPVRALGVLIVVGGPQVRIGSHRQFVALARWLAMHGHATLRFDVRGMGDSTGTARSFDELHDDIAAGIDALLTTPGVERVALWGLCDGASACLLYVDAARDARIAGLALLNPWVRSEESLAHTHVKHYYRQRLLQRAFWNKLVRGGIGLRAIQDLLRNLRRLRRQPRQKQRSFQECMASGWQSFGGGLLVLLSDTDWTAREFEEQYRSDKMWAGARGRQDVVWRHITGADHTLSAAPARMAAEQATLAWLRELG